MTPRRRFGAVAAFFVAVLLVPTTAAAHPLGNFTTNTAAHLEVEQRSTRIHYVVDLAEIPALQAIRSMDADGDGEPEPSETDPYRRRACEELVTGLDLRLGGRPLDLPVESSVISFPEGQAGLSTLRLECEITASYPAVTARDELAWTDANHEGRIGWREITASGAIAVSDVPERSPTDGLRSYPDDVGGAPPSQRSATLVVEPGGAAVTGLAGSGSSPVARGADRLSAALSDLVAERQLTVPFALAAVAIAVVLGTMHALAPGHGKTVMAAYLIGRRGSTRQALMLGATVALTHTMGVVVLGVLLSASETLVPERLYPWLGVASGLLFAGVGLVLLRGALMHRRSGRAHVHHAPLGHAAKHHDHHDHPGGANHHHHGYPANHGAADLASATTAAPLWRSMIAPGLAGGLVPSPSALVVLLGGIALGRAWFGLALVVCYGVGMAVTLVGAGLLLQHARTRLDRRSESDRWPRLARATAALPLATAVMVIVGGLVIALRSGITA